MDPKLIQSTVIILTPSPLLANLCFIASIIQLRMTRKVIQKQVDVAKFVLY